MPFTLVKKIVGIVLVAAILAVAYYGSYLPMKKSQAFIKALSALSNVRSLDELEKILSEPLDLPSPIGQEELVRNMGNTMISVLRQLEGNSEVVARLLSYVNSYYQPIITRGKGMSFTQNLYILAALNEIAFLKAGEVSYREKAKNYYAQGLSLGPTRPQFLYGLLYLYTGEGNWGEAKKLAEQIVAQWPEDKKTQALIEEIKKNLLTGAQ